jgi:hypothetical protein
MQKSPGFLIPFAMAINKKALPETGRALQLAALL